MQQSVVVIGQGEMGGVFSRAFLRAGYAVIPVTRNTPISTIQQQWPQPELVVVAVNEKAFPELMPSLTGSWRESLLLIQNELLPADWLRYDEQLKPNVMSVWFEKKPGQDVKVIIPSPVYGSHSTLIADALATLDIPSNKLSNSDQLLYQLLLKNVYILTSNIAGLAYGGSVGELWQNHAAFTRKLSNDVIDIQTRLCGTTFDKDRLFEDMLLAFNGDPAHQCMGRSAPARLQSALQHADHFALAVPTVREVAANCNN